jgi:hypothetical protein
MPSEENSLHFKMQSLAVAQDSRSDATIGLLPGQNEEAMREIYLYVFCSFVQQLFLSMHHIHSTSARVIQNKCLRDLSSKEIQAHLTPRQQ